MLSRGGVCLALAAAHAGVSQPTASDAVAALERKGLIEKRADPGDGRALALKATRSGRAVAGRWRNNFEHIAAVIPEVDQARLLGIVIGAVVASYSQQLKRGMRMSRICMKAAPAALLAMLGAGTAAAQEGADRVDEIVVVGDRVNLMHIPGSDSARQLHMTGCLGPLCRTEVWTRVIPTQ